VLVALASQLLAGLVTAASMLLVAPQAPLFVALATHCLLAAAAGAWLGLPGWWIPINFLFVPALVGMLGLQLPAAGFLAGFVVLVLVFWKTHHTRVPLYLSSTEAGERLAELLAAGPNVRVLDLGCGFGGLLLQLAARRPEAELEGVEIAPLPALIAWLRSRRPRSCRVRRADFWRLSLREYDLVYAFLSPAAMPALWEKVKAEMRPGTLFVSNSFAIPGVEPDRIIPLGGRGSCALYVWRL
jgi:SAM-dependent methyltransferase